MLRKKLLKIVSRTLVIAIFLLALVVIHYNPESSIEDKSIIVNGQTMPENIADGITKLLFKLKGSFKHLGYEETANESIALETVTLVEVVDGDTIYVCNENGETIKVRLIGIDTPESVHADETKNNIYGVLASAYTQELLSGITTLYLEYDEEKTDSYDRTLAYVWLSNDTKNYENMLNAKLLIDGYAYDKVYGNNNKYAEIFEQYRKEAQSSKSGLWSMDGFENLWN